MPVAAAVAPLVGSLGSAAIGAIAGGANKRQPSLSPVQQHAYNADLSAATKDATGVPTIDPTLLNANLDANARSLTGANNQITNSLVSRGLGRSGILAQGLENNAAQSSANQTAITSNLQNAAIQNQQFNRSLLAQLTRTPDQPGQSTFGAATAGAAAPLAYGLQTLSNNYQPNAVPPSVPGTTGAVNNNTISSGVFGTVPFQNAQPNVS